MVFFAPLIGAAIVYSTLVTAAPVPYTSSAYSPAYTAAPEMGYSSSSSMMESSSSMMYESKSEYNYYSKPSNNYNSYSKPSYNYNSYSKPSYNYNSYSSPPPMYTSTEDATSTSMAYMSYSTPSYGSGMNNWGGYQSCVSQCIADNGGMSMGSYEMPTATSSMGSTGSGATHTVIVAPSQGVLRYVPMAVNASVGDTVMFMWGANNHTVTKGSALLPCNKTSDNFFTSGEHNKSFVFTQVVNDTNPTFFFCNTPGHCQKGMFGIINPTSNYGSNTSAEYMMPSMMNYSTSLTSMSTYMNMMNSSSMSQASAWGNSMDFSAVPSWAQSAMGENIAFTRTFLAANPSVIDSTGKVDLGKATAPFVVPNDLAASQNLAQLDTNASSSAAPVATGSSSVVASSASASPSSASSNTKSSGALSVRSSIGVASTVAAIVALAVL